VTAATAMSLFRRVTGIRTRRFWDALARVSQKVRVRNADARRF